jgi:molybdopterin molybdotransferase
MATPQPRHINADVRMRGFAERSTVEAALAWLDGVLPTFAALPTEEVDLREAAGRVLAQQIVSLVDVPGFPRSMMDGFALRGEDTYGASPYNHLPFKILGTSLPGEPFAGQIAAGEAIRIMTGAPLPAGADAVLPVEETEFTETTLQAAGQVPPGKHVGQIGEDIRRGDVVLPAGRLLRPQDIGVLSSIGCNRIEVVRRPVVRIVVTGNELLASGTVCHGFRITDANGPMLAALVTRDGGAAQQSAIVLDRPDDIRAELEKPADVVLVSGGSSVGQEDHVPSLLATIGELAIHGIAMRPSSPTGVGRIGNRLVFLLPGNPVSCLCAYDFFAGRAIRPLGGFDRDWPYRRRPMRLARKLVSTVGRVDYARVQFCGNEIEPVAVSGASVLSSTTRADGFVIVPADSEGYPVGAEVEVFLY